MNQKVMAIEGVHCYLDENGVAWLNAEDVARGLGFTRTEIKNGKEYTSILWHRVNKYLEDFGFRTNVCEKDYIPENMFYRLAMKANNETARKFQAKIADEVLPAIRKQGVYMTPEAAAKILYNPDFIINLAQQVKDANAKIAILQPKADYTDKVLQSPSTILTTTIAKLYDMSAQMFNKLLNSCGIQYYKGNSWHLSQKYAGHGYVEYETVLVGTTGRQTTRTQMKWTEKGKNFLINFLRDAGILTTREKAESGYGDTFLFGGCDAWDKN